MIYRPGLALHLLSAPKYNSFPIFVKEGGHLFLEIFPFFPAAKLDLARALWYNAPNLRVKSLVHQQFTF